MSPQTDSLPQGVPPLRRLGAAMRAVWPAGYDGDSLSMALAIALARVSVAGDGPPLRAPQASAP